MATMKTAISWTDSTWNPTTGCTKVSPGCDNCYAERLYNRLFGDFSEVKMHADRLKLAARFSPLLNEDGTLRPRLVFVNSMSDLMHEDITDAFRDLVFDAMEGQPQTIFQVLTKRPIQMRRYILARYPSFVPRNIWLGFTVEDNAVGPRINIMRKLKDKLPGFTAFLSVEPLIGPVDQHDYTGIDQVLLGGESGPGWRKMLELWAMQGHDEARRVGAAVWFKQWGAWPNNPLYQQANEPGHITKVKHAIAAGEKAAWIELHKDTGKEVVKGEKGGATLRGKTIHEYPPAFAAIALDLNRGRKATPPKLPL